MCVWVCDGLLRVDLILQISLLLRECQVYLLHRKSECGLMSCSAGEGEVFGVCVCICTVRWNHDILRLSHRQPPSVIKGSEASEGQQMSRLSLQGVCVCVCEKIPLAPRLAGRLWRTGTFDTSRATSYTSLKLT